MHQIRSIPCFGSIRYLYSFHKQHSKMAFRMRSLKSFIKDIHNCKFVLRLS